MDASHGRNAPTETRLLISPFDITEVEQQLQDATVRWDGNGSVEVQLRGPSRNIALYFIPSTSRDSHSILIEARLTENRNIAISLDRICLLAFVVASEEQEPLEAGVEAHTLALSRITIGTTYLLHILHPPAVQRGVPDIRPTHEEVDLSDSFFDQDAETGGRGRQRQVLMSA